MLISATLSDSVKALVGKALRAPKYIDASSAANKKRLKNCGDLTEDGMSESMESTAHQIPQQLSQHVALVDSPHRLVALIGFLRQQIVASRALSRAAASTTSGDAAAAPTGCRIVVFLATCASVDFHYALFDKLANSGGATSGVAAGLTDVASLAAILRNSLYKLHGEVNQSERSKTFKDFCTSGNGVLLCTDVAARGLDMPNINWIGKFRKLKNYEKCSKIVSSVLDCNYSLIVYCFLNLISLLLNDRFNFVRSIFQTQTQNQCILTYHYIFLLFINS